MMRSWWGVVAVLACTPSPASENRAPAEEVGGEQQGNIRAQSIAQGLTRPIHLISPAGDSRMFVVEQPGRIRIIENQRLLQAPFLDITDRVRSSGNEQGLLSLAFHPSYSSNGFFYVNYTDLQGNTQVVRFRVSSDRNRADVASAKPILSVAQPAANHNGGHVLFGPDGMLYVGMGDGGRAGDPWGNAQNTNELLGKVLRLDVDGGDPYRVPPSNPFVGRAGFRGEIWAYGVRNPWRMAFDRTGGQLYIADVGQNAIEEINVVSATEGGLNFGWNRMEGSSCYPPNAGASCNRMNLRVPQVEYPHSEGCSVTGGYVYRGRAIPGIVGHYFYADYCQGWVRSFRYTNGTVTDQRNWNLGGLGQILSFGEDSTGELYILSMNGNVYKIVPV